MKRLMLFIAVAVSIPSHIHCRPEILVDTDRYAAPTSEFLPDVEPSRQFAPTPRTPYSSHLTAGEYGPPAVQQTYGPPTVQQTYGPPATLQKLITKNVYIHVPPPEAPEFQPAQIFEVPVQKKHYKIVFIKAPTAPPPTKPVIPPQPQDEHKTLVYVLVKKPDPQPQIEIPKIQPTEPSKPEVYFIKYSGGDKVSHEYGPPPQ